MNFKRINGLQALTFLLLLVMAGALGVYLDRAGWLPRGPGVPGKPLIEAWRLVERYYVERPELVPAEMTQGAIRGLVNSLGDTGHTSYLTKKEFEELENSLKGQFEGIGARFTIRKKADFVIVHTLPDSPARRAGLLPGDVLLQVNGKSLQGVALEKVAQSIRGPAGTTVELRVRRPGQATPLNFTLRRAKVSFSEVSWQLLPGTAIVHVALMEFGTETDKEFRQALKDARQQGAKSLILDLRGNPGGLKDQAVAIASEFLKSGNVFLEQDAEGKRKAVPVLGDGVATEIPLCVLIDKGTASSAEIVAGAIQDHNRGKLVGTRTFGTGTVLAPFNLSDGSVVLLAVVEWLTPNGRRIWHEGITPDIDVTLPEDAVILLPDAESTFTAAELAKSEDKQLLKAVQVLTGK